MLLGFLNSLWKYNTLTNEMTWIKGTVLLMRQVLWCAGIENETNKPGARYGSQT
jgi:hypothetical protein